WAGRGGRLAGSSRILAGSAVSTCLTAMVSGIMMLLPNQFERIVFWNLGSFSGATWDKVVWTGGASVIGFLSAMVFARDLDLMLLGEEHAHHLGLPVRSRKILFLGASALLASAAVASCGIIAFAGLIVPNIVRAACGSANRKLIPLSGLAGASFLLVADTLSRTLFAPVQVPVSIFTALAGAPFFLYLLAKNSRKTSDKETV
ncbi:MAG: iron ABC transporter permease, partial [Spirochaetaceae bacterium]